MPEILPLGTDWSEKVRFKYSVSQEMLWSLHILDDPSHHQDFLDWSLRINNALASDLVDEIQYLAANFGQWGTFLSLVETIEGEKILTWPQVETELTQMGQALFVYYTLGRQVNVADLIKIIRQPAGIEAFLRSQPDSAQTEILRNLLLDPEYSRNKLVTVLREYWDSIFARAMKRIEEPLLASLEEKIALFKETGIAALLNSLGLGIRLNQDVIVGKAIVDDEVTEVRLAFSEVDYIQIIPTVFAFPHLFPVFSDKNLILRYPCPYPEEPSLSKCLDETQLLQVFKALADVTRLRILQILANQSMYSRELATELGFSEPTVSRHMQLLKEAGLVSAKRKDNCIYYQLRKKVFEAVGPSLMQQLNSESPDE